MSTCKVCGGPMRPSGGVQKYHRPCRRYRNRAASIRAAIAMGARSLEAALALLAKRKAGGQ